MGDVVSGLASVPTRDVVSDLMAIFDQVRGEPWFALAVIGAVLVALFLLVRGRGPVCHPGEVWFAMVPFEDGTGAKDRPVLVLAVSRRTCTVARLTSQDRGSRRNFVPVPRGLTGLARASWISLRETTLRRTAMRRRTGCPGPAAVHWYRSEQPARRTRS